jgi:NAD(P)-dependent dehydrogenase (short-subunit alcohol dehydrogenase family)
VPVDFAGKIALVTGGASGIGAATATRLAEEGCRVVVVDLQDDLGAKQAAEIGGRYVRADVGDAAAWSALVDGVLAEEGRLDVAHLNAGVVSGNNDIATLTDEQYHRILGPNVHGVVYGTRAVIPAMARSGGGAVVATASVAGLIGFALDPIYTLTKHAVVGFVRAAAPQLQASGITLNCVCPGIVDTPLLGEQGKAMVTAAGYPVIPPSQIADGVVEAIRSGRTGEAWVCLAGRDAEPFAFGQLSIEPA